MNDKPNQQTPTAQVVWLVVAIFVCFTAAGIGGAATTSNLADWYAGLNKPSWNPPNWIFGPVWSTLYLMMSISVWLVWRRSGFQNAKSALIWFGIQLVLNTLWSVLFFGLHQPGWAIFEIIALWLAIAITIGLFWKHSKLAATLLVPYLLWVSFASWLNFTIWSLNR